MFYDVLPAQELAGSGPRAIPAGGPGACFSRFAVNKLADPHIAVGEYGPYIQATTQCLNTMPKRRDIHVRLLFKLGNGGLIYF